MTCESAVEAHRRLNAIEEARVAEAAVVKQRCERGLHVTIPIVREKIGDLVHASTCCDRLFGVVLFNGQQQLIEIPVDRDKLDTIRGELDAGSVATDQRVGPRR